MVYTNKTFPNKEFEFPPPPLWLTWTQTTTWDPKTRKHVQDGKGQVRHQDSLQKAKHYLGRVRSDGTFWYSWAVYEWTGERYELRHSAEAGDKKADHPLWQRKLSKALLSTRDLTDNELDEALASIANAAPLGQT